MGFQQGGKEKIGDFRDLPLVPEAPSLHACKWCVSQYIGENRLVNLDLAFFASRGQNGSWADGLQPAREAALAVIRAVA